MDIRTAHLWTRCPAASRPVDDDIPHEPESDLAREARAVRWAVDAMLYGKVTNIDEVTDRNDVTVDLARIAADYVDVVRNWSPVKDALELHLDIADRRVIALDIGWDTREPGEDPRHLYAACATWPDLAQPVVFSLYQPRPWHPDGKWRHVTRTGAELSAWLGWFEQRQAAAYQDPQPTHAPAGDLCGRCRHRSRCFAAARAVYADRDQVATRTAGRKLTATELSQELDFLNAAEAMLTARKSGIEAEAEARIAEGEWIPWYFNGEGRGRREFTVLPAAVELLTGFKATREVLKTPSELEREGADRKTVKLISRTRPGKIGLKRINPKDIARMFK